MHIGNYLGLLDASEQQLVDALLLVADHHGDEPDIYQTCQLVASWSQEAIASLQPLIERYSEEKSDEPERLTQVLFAGPRTGSLALMRDLHDLWLLASEVQLCLGVLDQAAKALRDPELEAFCQRFTAQTKRQLAWLHSRIQQAAPQALVVAT
ncbi:hypothetical protein SAMD00079811_12000 [Scytonema sp. HK-05]|uniref:molybdopterin oxidoreductase n=1 Tax=Scytonema sp. HK-05 TaxID=1137095 RepID=UPI0009FAE729|nr:molybdopterin oxidoreductase [Scytonema sp. HK-05]BAY43620.1 hypothetical protein SAMD00079811_12000 [Scytonema sp. HK-05]